MKKYLFLLGLMFLVGCAYYNTYFNAQKRYDEAFKKQNSSKTKTLSGDIKKNYRESIKKCWKLIDTYSDSSDWADDALLLIAKSHYNLQEYKKSQRVLEQFLLKYSRSPLVPQAKLWLAKTYITEQRDDEALKLLGGLFGDDLTSAEAGQVYYILGDLYFQRENYDKAISNLEKAVDIADDDELLGNAYYMLGEIYFSEEKYEQAIQAYEQLKDLYVPPQREFEAQMQQVEAYSALKDFESAEKILKNMKRDLRFKKQFSLIETKLANLVEIQGDSEFASELYYDILKKYKNTDGASMAAFYLAQLYEYEFANMDSAEAYYKKVRTIKSQEEISKEAKERAQLLREYLKIRNQLRKDQQDLLSIARGDSTLEDSLEVEIDSTEIKSRLKELQEKDQPGNNLFGENGVAKDSTRSDSARKKIALPKSKKVAVSRTPEQVEESFKKNSFAKAEFFLLKYQNYDSALVSYQKYTELFPEDTVLTPKAFYALYFIYSDLDSNQVKADSIKRVILTRFPDTPYGQKLSGAPKQTDAETEAEQTRKQAALDKAIKEKYIQAENLLFMQYYHSAIRAFKTIAQEDSGTVWAKKARFAIAYTYEHYLHDIPAAVRAYTILKNEYPGTQYAKIASNKIKEPPPEPVAMDSDSTRVSVPVDSLNGTIRADSLSHHPPAVDSIRTTEGGYPIEN